MKCVIGKKYLPILFLMVVFTSLLYPDGEKKLQVLKEGDTATINGREAAVIKLDTLPYIENKFSKSFVTPAYGDPGYKELRSSYKLDEIIEQGKTEFEKMIMLMQWSNSRFDFGEPAAKDEEGMIISLGRLRQPLEILERAKKEQKFFCVQFAAVFTGAANSLGWTARLLGTATHTFCEIWSNQYGKWVHMDPTANFYVEKDGIPLSTYEARYESFANDGIGLSVIANGKKSKNPFRKYPYALYIPNADNINQKKKGVPFFILKDKYTGVELKYQGTYVEDKAELDFPVNQAAIALSPGRDGLEVNLRTFTPNFEIFKVRFDEKEWKESKESFNWILHKGKNILEARSINKFGVAGNISTVLVEFDR